MKLGLNGNRGARADYLGGDPATPEPITGGRLAADSGGLLFTGPDGSDLRLELDRLLGITISGRVAKAAPARRSIRGTMRVAGLLGAAPSEWVFAVDRSAAVRLRALVERGLEARGRECLPFVEELDGFPLGNGVAPAPPTPAPSGASDSASPDASGDDSDRGGRLRRILPWALLGTVMIAAEVVVPLLLLRG